MHHKGHVVDTTGSIDLDLKKEYLISKHIFLFFPIARYARNAQQELASPREQGWVSHQLRYEARVGRERRKQRVKIGILALFHQKELQNGKAINKCSLLYQLSVQLLLQENHQRDYEHHLKHLQF